MLLRSMNASSRNDPEYEAVTEGDCSRDGGRLSFELVVQREDDRIRPFSAPWFRRFRVEVPSSAAESPEVGVKAVSDDRIRAGIRLNSTVMAWSTTNGSRPSS